MANLRKKIKRSIAGRNKMISPVQRNVNDLDVVFTYAIPDQEILLHMDGDLMRRLTDPAVSPFDPAFDKPYIQILKDKTPDGDR